MRKSKKKHRPYLCKVKSSHIKHMPNFNTSLDFFGVAKSSIVANSYLIYHLEPLFLVFVLIYHFSLSSRLSDGFTTRDACIVFFGLNYLNFRSYFLWKILGDKVSYYEFSLIWWRRRLVGICWKGLNKYTL